jgi:antitoxin component YwqK of YwqJK toxin-antitoxin module
MNLKVIAVCLFFVICFPVIAQVDQSVNLTDKEGRKQGHWIKRYPNGNVMYEGFFANDKPAGEFKRYYEDNTLKSVLVFSKNGTEAKATLFYSNGLVASAGKYVNQLKEGKWRFFSAVTKGLLVSESEYSGDKKNGLSVKYYPDSTIAEKVTYVNDEKHGEYLKYYPDGTLTLNTSYLNGKMDGKFEAFYENGKPEFMGQYKNDLREGTWIIYGKDGSQRFKTEYTLGVPNNRDVDIYQSNYIDSLERNKVKIADPEKTGEKW